MAKKTRERERSKRGKWMVACVYGRKVSNSGWMPKWPELFQLEEKASKRSLDLNGETGLSSGNRAKEVWILMEKLIAVIFFVRVV
jgi:hypothetical protein